MKPLSWKWALGIGVVAALACAAHVATRPVRAANARKIMDLPEWNAALDAYYPLPDGDILLVQDSWRTAVTSLHGDRRREAALAARLPRFRSAEIGKELNLSPDGKWFLYNEGGKWQVVSSDGSQAISRRSRPSDGLSGYWLPDSRHWFALSSAGPSNAATAVTRYDRDSENTTSARRDMMWDYYRQLGAFTGDHGLGITGRVSDGAVSVVTFSVSPDQEPRNIWHMPVPPDAVGDLDVSLSHKRDRLVWRFYRTPPPLGIGKLNHTAVTRWMKPTHNTLWISDLDGRNMRMVYDADAADQIADVSWSADDREILFVNHQKLWGVSAQ